MKYEREAWATAIFFIVLGTGFTAFYASNYILNEYNRVHYIAWTDIGHVSLVLPLFDGTWHYRYDIQTNFHGIITLREAGLPQPNLVSDPEDFFSCNHVSYVPNHFYVNETVGIIYYPACGYQVKLL